MGPGSQASLSISSCVAWMEALNLSGRWVPRLQNGQNNTCLTGLLLKLNQIMFILSLEPSNTRWELLSANHLSGTLLDDFVYIIISNPAKPWASSLCLLVYFPVPSPVHTFRQPCDSGDISNLTKPQFPHLCKRGHNSSFLRD